MHPSAAEVLQKLGGDPSDFSARQLTRRIANDADLIVTMTRAHRDAVLEVAPRLLNRTFTLGEIARLATAHNAVTVKDLARERARLSPDEALDVADPIGHSLEFHARIGAQISAMLTPALDLFQRSV